MYFLKEESKDVEKNSKITGAIYEDIEPFAIVEPQYSQANRDSMALNLFERF